MVSSRPVSLVRAALVLVALASIALPTSVDAISAVWIAETADTSAQSGLYASLQIDAGGRPHILYSKGFTDGNSLLYAVRDGSSWTKERVPPIEGDWLVTVYSGSLLLDSLDAADITFIQSDFEYVPAELYYATNRTGAWVRTQIHGCGSEGSAYGEIGWASMAKDNLGTLGVSYSAHSGCPTGDGIWYARKSGPTSWSKERAAYTTYECYTSLAYDAARNPAIAWYEAAYWLRDLRYTYKRDGTWTTETVDAPGDVGLLPSLVIDAQDNPHVSYYDATRFDLRYATKVGGSWVVATVDSQGTVGSYSSLAFDSDGFPVITYRDTSTGDLKCAWKRDSNWDIGVIDTSGNTGYYSSLEFNATGIPSVAYYNSNLRFAQVTRMPASEVTGLPLHGALLDELRVYPNPSSDGQVLISAALAGSQGSRVTIFDSVGRRVRSLLIESSDRQTVGATWNGRAEDGQVVPSGHYFISVQTPSGVRTRSVTILR